MSGHRKNHTENRSFLQLTFQVDDRMVRASGVRVSNKTGPSSLWQKITAWGVTVDSLIETFALRRERDAALVLYDADPFDPGVAGNSLDGTEDDVPLIEHHPVTKATV
jgi:hypothetical protein